MLNSPSAKELYCFDFDQTIVKDHFHSKLFQHFKRVASQTESYKEFIQSNDGLSVEQKLDICKKDLLEYFNNRLLLDTSIKHLNMLAKSFIDIHNKGAHISITSFTWFPYIAKPTIQFILETHLLRQSKSDILNAEDQQLINEIIKNILVVGGFPTHRGHPMIGEGDPKHPDCKQQHIKQAMDYFKIEDFKDVILIDDSPSNTIKARRAGCKAIDVPKQKDCKIDYLYQLSDIINPSTPCHRKELRKSMTGFVMPNEFYENPLIRGPQPAILLASCGKRKKPYNEQMTVAPSERKRAAIEKKIGSRFESTEFMHFDGISKERHSSPPR